jgi:hypothetical protein
MRVGFGEGGWTEHRVDRLERPAAIEWTCTAQAISRFTPPDEWVGTRMSFDLGTVGERKKRLVFVHHGLRPRLHRGLRTGLELPPRFHAEAEARGR